MKVQHLFENTNAGVPLYLIHQIEDEDARASSLLVAVKIKDYLVVIDDKISEENPTIIWEHVSPKAVPFYKVHPTLAKQSYQNRYNVIKYALSKLLSAYKRGKSIQFIEMKDELFATASPKAISKNDEPGMVHELLVPGAFDHLLDDIAHGIPHIFDSRWFT